jgi:hypothetical protein
LTVVFLVLGSTAPAFADDVSTELDVAWRDLEKLEDLLDDRHATNREITAYMDAVVQAIVTLQPKEEGDGDDAAAVRAWNRSLDKLRAEALDLLLEGLTETNLDRAGQNEREPVNVHAGALLGKASAFLTEEKDRRRFSRRVIRKVKRLEKARHEVGGDVFEGVFVSLAQLGDMRSFEWLVENYLHTRKQPKEVARLHAGLRGLLAFDDVTPQLRYALVKEMVKLFVAMESLANQSTTNTSALAAKRFWGAVQTDVIPLIQKTAGYPKNKSGVALATMSDFSAWFREHKDVRASPWIDEPKRTG